MTPEEKLKMLADIATELGLDVSTGATTEVEGYRAGQKKRWLSIGYFQKEGR